MTSAAVHYLRRAGELKGELRAMTTAWRNTIARCVVLEAEIAELQGQLEYLAVENAELQRALSDTRADGASWVKWNVEGR